MLCYNVIRTKHNGKENRDFELDRPTGTNDYLFLHFKTPVIFTIFNKTHHISPGTCILMSPGTAHAFYPDDCDLVHDWVHFMPSDCCQFEASGIDINNFFTPVSSDFITAAVKRCEHELINKDKFYEDVISAEMTGMFVKLKRQLCGTVSGNHTEAFKLLRMDIYRNPDRYADTKEMAKSVNLSRSRFSVVYKDIFGIPPVQDHIAAKIEKAAYLLSVGTFSLEKISEICGYQNIYHFIRQFRGVMGITPGQYRKNH